MAEPETAVLVGFRFHPTDEELVGFYLRNKNLGNESAVKHAINEIDICKFDPWDLPWQSKLPSDDCVWFFFCPRVSKFSNSKRTSRTTRAGYWKGTGVDRKIKAKKNGNVVIGTKKTLVFYLGRVPNGQRTDWVMHEYQSTFLPLEQRSFVLCKVKDKKGEKTGISSLNGSESSYSLASESSNMAALNTPFEVNQPAQETPEFFHDHGLSVAELDPLTEVAPDFHNVVPASGQEGLSLAEQECPNGITSEYNVQRPSDLFTEDDLKFLNELRHVDRRFVEELFVEQDNFVLGTSVYEHFSDYRPPQSLTGVYEGYSSDSDAESISAGTYQETSSPADSVGSSKENNQIPDCGFGGTQKDGSADLLSSANTAKSQYESRKTSDADEYPTRIQFQGKALHNEAPIKTREAVDLESTDKLSKDKEPTIMAREAREKTSTKRNVKEKGSYVLMEIVEICRKPDQLFASLLNVVVGSILFAVTIRGIWSLH